METETFVPFHFDGNRWNGPVRRLKDWLELCEGHRRYFSTDSEGANRIELMRRSQASNITQRVEGGEVSAPDWYEMPNFGLRGEHIGQDLTLEEWLKSKGMYELLLNAGLESENAPVKTDGGREAA